MVAMEMKYLNVHIQWIFEIMLKHHLDIKYASCLQG